MYRQFLLLPVCLVLYSSPISAQIAKPGLPNAPRPQTIAQESAQIAVPVVPNSPTTPSDETLTRQQAEQLALKNNPQIGVAALSALAQKTGRA